MLSPEHSDMKHLISLHFPWVQVGATIVSGVSHSPFHCHLKQLDFYYLWLIPQMAIESHFSTTANPRPHFGVNVRRPLGDGITR